MSVEGWSVPAHKKRSHQRMSSNFTCHQSKGIGQHETRAVALSGKAQWRRGLYHRRPMPCCMRPGETEGGGLDMVTPVVGLMMGMALRARVAAG